MPVLECLNEEVVVKLMVCVPSKLILQLRLPQSHGGKRNYENEVYFE
jgi:hypothetical protein